MAFERVGLVTRGPQHNTTSPLRSRPLAAASAWLEHNRQFCEGSLDRIGEHLARLQGRPTLSPTDRKGTQRMVELEFVRSYAAPQIGPATSR